MNRKPVPENERFECQQLSIESQRLEAIGKTMYDHRTDLQIRCLQNTIRKEYASGSILHRGFYCPSPVYDIISGNAKRGKLLKKPFIKSKPSHEYGFDVDGYLLYCKRFDNTVVSTEYLDYSPDTVHGMLLDGEGFISVITEETYDQGRLMRFLQCSCMPTDDGFYCHQAYCEEYEYDEEGLRCCKTQNLLFPLPDTSIFLKSTFPQSTQWPVYCSDEFLFQRADGYLSGYTCGQQTYRISVRRKA